MSFIRSEGGLTLLLPYLVSTLLLVLHQIDAVYYREWEMFLLPGGYVSYLVFNLVAVPPILYGMVQVARGAKSAFQWSMLTAALTLATFVIHTLFSLLGDDGRFEMVLSQAIIYLCLPSSLWLGFMAFRTRQ